MDDPKPPLPPSPKPPIPGPHPPLPPGVEQPEACFVVRDGDTQQLAYVYFEDEPGRTSAAKLRKKKASAI